MFGLKKMTLDKEVTEARAINRSTRRRKGKAQRKARKLQRRLKRA